MGFKERLKEKRLEAGLTQAELAEKVSVTTRTIQNYEMGSRKPGNMKVIGDLATVLGTTVDYLFGGSISEGRCKSGAGHR
jgi:transcriptional regulator with XRE-family HTH domain